MVGLFFFVHGLTASVAAVVLLVLSQEDIAEHLNVKHSGESCGFWYYLIFFVIAAVTFVLYIGVSKWYKNRQRGDLEGSERYYRRQQQQQQHWQQSTHHL